MAGMGVHHRLGSSRGKFSLSAISGLIARNCADISKGKFHQPDRQFEYLLDRHAYALVMKRLFLSIREAANLRYCLKNFGCGILQYARGAIFSQIMRASSARILWWRVS
jgi:hypothetical protein